MKYKQVKTGFMERFEGCWRVEPILVDEKSCFPLKPKIVADYMSFTNGKGRIGSKVSLEQIKKPSIVTPPPISWHLRGITTRNTEILITDLFVETAQIKGVSTSASDISEGDHEELVISKKSSDDLSARGICDINKRWAMQTRNVRPGDQRLK